MIESKKDKKPSLSMEARLNKIFKAQWPGVLGIMSAAAALLALPFICNIESFQIQEASSLLYIAPLFALLAPICVYGIMSLCKREELAEDLTGHPITNVLIFLIAPFSAFYISALYVYLDWFSTSKGIEAITVLGTLSLCAAIIPIIWRNSG